MLTPFINNVVGMYLYHLPIIFMHYQSLLFYVLVFRVIYMRSMMWIGSSDDTTIIDKTVTSQILTAFVSFNDIAPWKFYLNFDHWPIVLYLSFSHYLHRNGNLNIRARILRALDRLGGCPGNFACHSRTI